MCVCVCMCVCTHVLGASICQFLHIIFYFDLDLSPVELTTCECFILDMVSLL